MRDGGPTINPALFQSFVDRIRGVENQNRVLAARLDRHVQDQPRQPWRQPLGGSGGGGGFRWFKVTQLISNQVVLGKRCNASGVITNNSEVPVKIPSPSSVNAPIGVSVNSIILAIKPEGGTDATYLDAPVAWYQYNRQMLTTFTIQTPASTDWSAGGYHTAMWGTSEIKIAAVWPRTAGQSVWAVPVAGGIGPDSLPFLEIGPFVFC